MQDNRKQDKNDSAERHVIPGEAGRPGYYATAALFLLFFAVLFAGCGKSAFRATIGASSASQTAVNKDPVATSAQQNGANKLAQSRLDEQYSFDIANKHWAYHNSKLSIDIKKLYSDKLKCWYYLADIQTTDASAMFSVLSDKADPSKNRALPKDLAAKGKTVFAINGDLFVARNTGVIIRSGKIWRDKPKEPILAFYKSGDMKVFNPTEKTAQQLVSEGVTDTFAFGPILIRDGTINHDVLKKDRLRPRNPRTGIGMVDKGHFISIVVEGRQPGYSEGVTLDDFALMFRERGCTTAYNLDGGQSAVMVFMGQLLNSHKKDMNGTQWNSYRHISELLCFGTSEQVPVQTQGNTN